MTPGLGGESWHRQGRPWYTRPSPRWWHRCRVDSVIEEMSPSGIRGNVEHCACGGWRMAEETVWCGRNSQRRSRRTTSWVN